MFGVNLPSISDATSALQGAAASTLHTTADLGASALSRAASLGRSGMDLGRTAVDAVSHVDVQALGGAASRGIADVQHAADAGIRSQVLRAGQGLHAAADDARGRIHGDGLLPRAARDALTQAEGQARGAVGLVGGVGKAAVSLTGSAAQLGVLATEHEGSPLARQAIDARTLGATLGAAKSLGGYAGTRTEHPGRLIGDARSALAAGGAFVDAKVAAGRQAIAEGHGPESFGMTAGELATYVIPVVGEARAAGAGMDVAGRAAAEVLGETASRTLAADGARAVLADERSIAISPNPAEGAVRASSTPGPDVSARADASHSPYANLIDSTSVGPGKAFTPVQRASIYQQNLKANEGVLRSDLDGE